MIKGSWERGEAPGFWMEDDPPTGVYDSFIYDDTNDTSGYRYLLLTFLARLGVIEHGCIYESTECIRIRVKDA